MSLWLFEESLPLLRALEKDLAAVGWHLALAGSVLFKGESSKDLDVILYPHNTSTTGILDQERARDVLREHGFKLFRTQEEISAYWKALGSTDEKHVEAWGSKGARLDVFFMR